MRTRALAVAVVAVALVAAGSSSASLIVASTIPVGKHPAGVAVAAGSVWVTNDVDNTVSRIDPATGEVTDTIALHGAGYPDPTFVAVSDDALWVASRSTGTISRIDLRTGELAATLSVPGDVLGLVVHGTALWVPSFDPYRCAGNRCFSRLTRIDARSNKVAGKFDVASPTGIASFAGSLWIVDHREKTVTRFDPRNGKAIATIPVGIAHEGTYEGPERVTAGLRNVWVSDPGRDVITCISPWSNKVVARIRLPRGSEPIQLTVGAGSLWAVGPKRLFRIDPRTKRVSDSVRIGTHPAGDYKGLRQVAVSAQALWVTDGDADTVDRIDLGPGG
jgi:YVTN family beta-propeller protein